MKFLPCRLYADIIQSIPPSVNESRSSLHNHYDRCEDVYTVQVFYGLDSVIHANAEFVARAKKVVRRVVFVAELGLTPLSLYRCNGVTP